MIRNINLVYLKKAIANLQLPLSRMTYLQAATVLLIILIFLLLQQASSLSKQYIHNILIVFWVAGELVASLLFSSIRQMIRSNTSIGSQKAKQEIGTIRAYLIALKHVKFLNILCNFLALLGKIKEIGHSGQMHPALHWYLVYLPLALLSLVIINTLLALYQKVLDIYNNFEMELGEEESQLGVN